MSYVPFDARPLADMYNPGRRSIKRRTTDDPELQTDEGQPISFGPPVKGLNISDAIAAIPDGYATVLENWICLDDGPRVRGGAISNNTGLSGEVHSFIAYHSGTLDKLFCVSGNATHAVFDITASGAVGAAIISGLVATVWSTTTFTSSGGTYAWLTGKGNAPRAYDGSAWTTPAITGVTTTNLSMAWAHGKRMFFVEGGTTNAWYLSVDAIAGAAVKFPLVGEFQRGGSLVAGSTWTPDAGNSSLSASCVFISSEGEIAVYQGADPATWTSLGTFYVGKPCGPNCFMKAGGDLIVMTEDGKFALSQIMSLDRDALVNNSISRNIRPLWQKLARSTNRDRWQIIRNNAFGYVLVTMPSTENVQTQLCVNIQTGAWSTFTGWKPTAMISTNGTLYFGTIAGIVYRADFGGMDGTLPYSATYVGPFKMAGLATIYAKMMRAVVIATETFSPLVAALSNYRAILPGKPSAGLSDEIPLWDSTFIWDVEGAGWAPENDTQDDWQVVEGSGHALAPCVIYTLGQVNTPQIKLIRCDMIIEGGDVIT